MDKLRVVACVADGRSDATAPLRSDLAFDAHLTISSGGDLKAHQGTPQVSQKESVFIQVAATDECDGRQDKLRTKRTMLRRGMPCGPPMPLGGVRCERRKAVIRDVVAQKEETPAVTNSPHSSSSTPPR
jgi:hypothetical protein